MTAAIPLISLGISIVAVTLSLIGFFIGRNIRRADSFAKLYDELNTRSFGMAMERLGEWIAECAVKLGKARGDLTESEIRSEYRNYLEQLVKNEKVTKEDELEAARRTVKAWFIKCLLFYYAADLTLKQLRHLVTKDRAQLMWGSFFMTREQTDVWNRRSHDPASRFSSDEQYFTGLADLGFLPSRSTSQPALETS